MQAAPRLDAAVAVSGAPVDKNERTVARLKAEEDGSLSNRKVERFALLLAEGICTEHAAWVVVMTNAGKTKLPSGGYLANIRKSPAFKRRVKELTDEREALQSQDDIWSQLEWQGRQLYRRGAAMDDAAMMMKGTDVLMKVAMKRDPPDRPEKPAGRGPGAPTVPTPEPADEKGATGADYMREKLIRQ